MSAYDALAPWYDALTPDVPYEQYADFYERVFAGREGNSSCCWICAAARGRSR